MELTQEQKELRQELIKHGADRWLFDVWNHYLIDYSFDKVLPYIKKGFTDPEFVFLLISENISVDDVLRAKELLISAGMKGKEAEEVLFAILKRNPYNVIDKASLAVNLYKEGLRSPKALAYFADNYAYGMHIYQRLSNKNRLEKDFTAKEEVEFLSLIDLDREFHRGFYASVKQRASQRGFSSVWLGEAGLTKKEIRKAHIRADFYEKLGFSTYEAEKWARYEIEVSRMLEEDVRLTEDEAKTLYQKKPSNLLRAMYVMKALELSVDEALKWAETDLDLNVISDWKEKGFTPEEAQKWDTLWIEPEMAKELKAHSIDYDTFVKVLEKSLYSGFELCEILERNDFDIKAVEKINNEEGQVQRKTLKP